MVVVKERKSEWKERILKEKRGEGWRGETERWRERGRERGMGREEQNAVEE